ncbi:MAG: hypothetical protein JWN76_3079 [Chitinophagaceae bacterium]|nr:hypothetical protein [Chitinophagaceae bacterium]
MSIILIDFFDFKTCLSKNYRPLNHLYRQFKDHSFEIITILVNDEEILWRNLFYSCYCAWPYYGSDNWWSDMRINCFQNILIDDAGKILGTNQNILQIKIQVLDRIKNQNENSRMRASASVRFNEKLS